MNKVKKMKMSPKKEDEEKVMLLFVICCGLKPTLLKFVFTVH